MALASWRALAHVAHRSPPLAISHSLQRSASRAAWSARALYFSINTLKRTAASGLLVVIKATRRTSGGVDNSSRSEFSLAVQLARLPNERRPGRGSHVPVGDPG